MKPFEKILVPIDFGLHSTEAMRRAVDVASHYGASLSLVYVYEPLDYALPEGYALYTPEQVGQLLDDFRERLSSAAREVEEMGAAGVKHEVLTGPAASEIVDGGVCIRAMLQEQPDDLGSSEPYRSHERRIFAIGVRTGARVERAVRSGDVIGSDRVEEVRIGAALGCERRGKCLHDGGENERE